jgi:hypothetical protein
MPSECQQYTDLKITQITARKKERCHSDKGQGERV